MFREHIANLNRLFKRERIVFLYGARRVGKTTLIEDFAKEKEGVIFLTGDDVDTHSFLSSNSVTKLKSFLGKNKFLIIDEAQFIPDIGRNLKLIYDHIPSVKVLATGSSSFELASKTGETLTGRKFVLKLYPFSQSEISKTENLIQTKANLEKRLIYGSYPEVVLQNSNDRAKLYLKELINSYLYKDILILEGIKKADKIVKLLQLIAFQIGKEVSIQELGNNLDISKNTAERYLNLLENCFVIQKLTGFSRNLRKEITKTSRYYFCDNGIRNALIQNYNGIHLRDDVGALFENYIVMERFKKQEYQNLFSNNYFWRTYSQQEIDLVEEKKGKLFGYEVSFNKTKKPPTEWVHNYPKAKYECITKENYLKFIL